MRRLEMSWNTEGHLAETCAVTESKEGEKPEPFPVAHLVTAFLQSRESIDAAVRGRAVVSELAGLPDPNPSPAADGSELSPTRGPTGAKRRC